MTHNALEARLARLERRTMILQWIAVGSALVTAVMIANACGKPSSTPPDRLELVSENGTARLDGLGLVLRGAGRTVRITADSIVMQGNATRVSIEEGVFKASSRRGEDEERSELGPGHMKLEASKSAIEAVVKPQRAELGLTSDGREAKQANQPGETQQSSGPDFSEHAQREVRLVASDFSAAVEAIGNRPSPTEQILSGLYATLDGAGWRASRIGEEKSLSIGHKK